MKKGLHIINILLLICEASAGAVVLFYADKSSMMPYICGGVTIVMSIAILISGALLPETDTIPVQGWRKAAKALLLVNTVVNNAVPNSAAVDTVNGEKALRRSWEPLAIIIWLFFQSIIAIFVAVPASGILRVFAVVTVAVPMILTVTSVIWKAEDNKERYGSPMLKSVLIPVIIFILIICIIGVFSYFKESRRWNGGGFSAPNQNNQVQESEDTEKRPETADSMLNSKKALLDKVSLDFPGETLYYRMLERENGGYSLVVWTDTADTVYIYLLKKDSRDCYVIESKMISDSLSKTDVEGKEEGIFGKKGESDD